MKNKIKLIFILLPLLWIIQASANNAIIVDAGSTGSRLYVYQYDSLTNVENIKLVGTQKISPGLTDVPLSELDIYLSTLFNANLMNKISESSAKNTPIYFYATAGMRMLNNKTQQEYYQYIKTWLAQNTPYGTIEAKTITGQHEGAYAWIAINALSSHSSDASQGERSEGEYSEIGADFSRA